MLNEVVTILLATYSVVALIILLAAIGLYAFAVDNIEWKGMLLVVFWVCVCWPYSVPAALVDWEKFR